MTRPLETIASDFAAAFKEVDAAGPVGRRLTGERLAFQPGIGPLTEAETVRLAVERLRKRDAYYDRAMPRKYPGSRSTCDLVIEGDWSLEFKQIRPFGDNGKEAEHWSQNALHPYRGHVSAIGDAMKLRDSSMTPAKAVVIFGYEHAEAVIPLEPVIRGFEVLVAGVAGIPLSDRITRSFEPLIHPVHQVGRLYAWQIGAPTG